MFEGGIGRRRASARCCRAVRPRARKKAPSPNPHQNHLPGPPGGEPRSSGENTWQASATKSAMPRAMEDKMQ